MTDNVKNLECEQAIRMVLEYLDRELKPHDHEALEAHIHKCRACYTRVEFERRLKNIVGDTTEQAAPDSLRSRIKKLSQQF